MNLFEFIDKVFGTDEKYSSLTSLDKEKNFFMLNRMMGIQFPKQANYLNDQGINKVDVVDFWRNFIKQVGFKGTPKFIYTKSTKKELDKAWLPSDEEKFKEYLNFYGYSRKDFMEASEYDPDDAKKSYNNYVKALKD